MTSVQDDYDQRSFSNTNNSRRMNANSNPPHLSNSGIELRLLVTSRDAGAVIGKGGSSIQKLRADHPRAMIQVPDCPSPERLVLINGDEEQCFDALRQIIPFLLDSTRLSSFNRRRSPNTDENLKVDQQDPSTFEIRLLIHQIYCGAVIGKGGQHVKELRQTHKLDIKVFSQCCPMSHERVIALRGKIDDILECIKHIYQLISGSPQQPRTSQLIQYDPHNFDVYTVNDYGGFQVPSGANGRQTYNPRGGYLPNSAARGGSYPSRTATAIVNAPYAAEPGLGARFLTTSMLTSTRVTLPNELVGAIIGPRGAKIQQIRQITSANIIIDDQAIPSGNGGSGDRIITIEGTPEQISHAQALLQQAVRQSGLWRP